MRALALGLLFAGCAVDIDYGGSAFRCTDECPAGFECVSGVCREVGTTADAGAVADAGSGIDARQFTCPAACSLVAGTDLCFCATVLNWIDARAACEDEGYRLSSIGDAATAMAARLDMAARANPRAWLGGTDVTIEGTWAWSHSGEVFWVGLADGAPPAGAFADFKDLEPNQNMGGEEDCLQSWDVGWNDARCTELRPYYCSE